MSKLKSAIDYKSLELELQEALKEDELYRLQNNAKLRAIEQNVPTYEDFRQMVLAAHLKPLQRSDIQPKTNKSWNPVVNNSSNIVTFNRSRRKQPDDCLKPLKNNDCTFKEEKPTTYEQFIQVWKTIETYEEKLGYLKNIKDILQDQIFRIEIPSTLLVEIINVFQRNVSTMDDISTIVDILIILSKCNRFALTISFMDQREKEICRKLFYKLRVNVQHKDDILEEKIRTLGLIYEIISEQ